MHKRFIVSVFTASIMLASTSMSVFAAESPDLNALDGSISMAEPEGENSDDMQRFNEAIAEKPSTLTMRDIGVKMGVDMDDVFESMQTSLQNGEPISFSEAINSFTSNPIATESLTDLSSFGLNSENTDFGMVNIQYSMLADQMQNQYATTDLSSDSQNSVALLNKEYGDVLSGVSLNTGDVQGNKLSMPDYVKGGLELSNGMTINGIMSNASNQINSLYASAAADSGLNSIRNSISVSSIFNEAANWKNTIGDPSSLTMAGAMASVSSLDQSAKNSAYSAYNSKKQSDYAAHQQTVADSDKTNMKYQKSIKSKPITWKMMNPQETLNAFLDMRGFEDTNKKTNAIRFTAGSTVSGTFANVKSLFSLIKNKNNN